MSRLNLEEQFLDGSTLRSKLRYGTLVQALGAEFPMDEDMPVVLFLDPGGAGRDVLLPPETVGLSYWIVNTADAAEDLTVKEDSDTTTIETVGQNEVGFFVCDGTTWHGIAVPSGITATAAEINNVADVSARVQELLASGAVTPGVQSLELNHASTIIAATVAAVIGAHDGFFMVKDTSASGTAAHTCTLTGGTWDGTNTIVTFNAPNEALLVYFDSAGDGTIIENVGAAVLS